MEILSGIQEIRNVLRAAHRRNIGLVPTMGALHAGHRSLVLTARSSCDIAVVSIFVNPTQFGPKEDFNKYPRTFEEDCRILEAEGVDLVFAPTAETMYPDKAGTFVDVGELGNRLDGASRPGHFRGVATVVAKLFHIIEPDLAFFGQKDAAQVAVLRKMVRDLNFPVELVVCPIVRESDGLAMSSRNRYLSAGERQQALVLSRTLQAAQKSVAEGEHRAFALRQLMTSILRRENTVRLDYVAVVDPDTLLPLDDVRSGALLAVAAFVGDTRLIDNVLLAPAS